MIARALRLLQVATWIVAAVLAFVVVSERSDAAPLPATATLTVTTWTGAGNSSQLRAELQRYAVAHQITFAQEVPDFSRRGAIRHLYLQPADPLVPGARWLTDGLGDFGGSMTTVVHPLQDAGARSPLGSYVVFGGEGKAEALRDFFTARDMTVDLAGLGRIGPVPRPVLIAGSAIGLLTISMVGAYVVAGTRRYAVGRLHGLPRQSLAAAELRRLAVWWAVAGVAVLGASTVLVRLRFGDAGLGRFALTATGLQLLLLGGAVTTYAMFLNMVTAVEMLPALKGELPARALSVTAYGLRITGVVVAVTTMATTTTLAADVAARDRSLDAFDRLGGATAVALGNAYTVEDQALLDATVGPWLRTLDRQGAMILAAQQTLSGPQWHGVPTLLVNDAFLAEQPVRMADGSVVERGRSQAVTVVVPDARWDSRDQLVPLLGIDAQVRADTTIRYDLRRAAPGQQIFTYAPAGIPSGSVNVWDTAATFITDPVLVVLPSARGWLSDTSYASFASQGGALVTDPRLVTAAVSDPLLERFVRGATPVADQAAAALADQASQLRMSLFTAGIACVVVVMSGVASALIHTRRSAQRVFVRHLAGWRFAVIHRSVLLVELVLLAGLVAWIPWRVAAQRRELQAWQVPGVPLPVDLPTVSTAQLVALAVLALVTSGGFLLALRYAHGRVVRWGATEA